MKFLLSRGPKYTWKKALALILFSVISSASLFFGLNFFFVYIRDLQAKKGCPILNIVQTSSKYLALPSIYLAEVLNLSADRSPHLLEFDLEDAKKKLEATHVIKRAFLKKIKPDTLYIEYEIREPIAYLEDYKNTAFDEEGIYFPFAPFFSQAILPDVYLGEKPYTNPWKEKIKEGQLFLIKDLLTRLDSKKIARIDLSQMEAKSAGVRQLIIVLKNKRILRLSPKNYHEGLKRYFILEERVLKYSPDFYVVDLRIDDVAYLQRV